jgi:hypothetical protein
MTARRKAIIAGIAAALVVGLALHGPLLRSLAGPLIADDPVGDYDYVGILQWYNGPDGDRCYDAAADLCRRRPSCQLLLVQSRSNRLVELGILPSFIALTRRQFESRGLPWKSPTILRHNGNDDWATARAIRSWLADRPNVTVVLLCGGFRSAHLRYALDTVLDPTQAARVRVHPLPDRNFDDTNWWKSRNGFKGFGTEWLRQFHGWFTGAEHRPPPYRSIDEYEDSVLRNFAEARP